MNRWASVWAMPKRINTVAAAITTLVLAISFLSLIEESFRFGS